MAASLAVIVIHHLGYRGFHTSAALPPVMIGCGLLSLAYLLTASPLAAVGGHIILHTALNLRGTELPPYATGGAHIVPLGQRQPASTTATPVRIEKAGQPSRTVSTVGRPGVTPQRQPCRPTAPLREWCGRAGWCASRD
jgi:hypothetical protein